MRSLWLGVLVCAAMLVACGDDDSDFATRPSDGSSSSVCEDCDDESSSSGKEIATNSSSSRNDKSSSSTKSSSSSAMSSSSVTQQSSSCSWQPPEILEPEITVNETCEDVGACDAMVKTDVSTWHFVRKDDFGDDAEYIYTADGRDLIVTIKSADGSTDSKTYSMYNMESEVGVEMAFNAAKSTCMDGGGNDNVTKACVKDTVMALPKCNTIREGFLGEKDSIYFVCKSGSWTEATELEKEIGYACIESIDGMVVKGADGSLKKCSDGKWVVPSIFDVPKEFYLNPDITYGTMTDKRDNKVYKTVKIGDQTWMAENLNYAYLQRTSELDSSSFCYNDSVEYCAKYGRLYTWAAAIDSVALATDADNPQDCGKDKSCTLPEKVQGICPEGWHLPRYAEWKTLFGEVGNNTTNLKSQTAWYIDGSAIIKGNGTDTVGFSALPAGYKEYGESDYKYGASDYSGWYSVCFWSSKQSGDGYALNMCLGSYGGITDVSTGDRGDAYSVRCLKD